MITRFELVNAAKLPPAKAKAKATKVIRNALRNGWTPESFERQFTKRPKLYTPKVRKLARSVLAALQR